MPKKKSSKEINPIVKKSNAIIRAKWKVDSVWALRLIALIAVRVRIDDKDFEYYEIPVSEMLGREYGGKDFKDVKLGVEKAMNKIIELPTEHGVAWVNPFFYCEFMEKKALLKLQFAPQMKEHYLDLKNKFTTYDYNDFMILPSTYSQRIYEILKSWQNLKHGKVVIKIDELHEMLNSPEEYRKDFGQFDRKVLKKAHKHIVGDERITSLWYSYTPIRKGGGARSQVTAVEFMFHPVKAERQAEKEQAEKRKADAADYEAVRKRAHECWFGHRDRGEKCEPNKQLQKCGYCTTRGMHYTASEEFLNLDNEFLKLKEG